MLKALRYMLDFRRLPAIVTANRSLLWQFVKRSVASRYRGSMLGLFWSFVQPMMMLCVYTFVFSVVFRSRWGADVDGGGRGSFAIIMFCGMAVFNIFSEAVNLNCSIVVANQNLVKKVIFPLEILPLSQTMATFAVGMVWFLLLFLGTVFIFGTISFTMLLLPSIPVPLTSISQMKSRDQARSSSSASRHETGTQRRSRRRARISAPVSRSGDSSHWLRSARRRAFFSSRRGNTTRRHMSFSGSAASTRSPAAVQRLRNSAGLTPVTRHSARPAALSRSA